MVGAVGFVLAWLLGTAAFASLGLLLAGTLRAEATLAAANLIYLLLLAGGAVVLPSTSYGAFGDFAQLVALGCAGRRDARGVHRRLDRVGLAAVPARVGRRRRVLTSRTFKWE